MIKKKIGLSMAMIGCCVMLFAQTTGDKVKKAYEIFEKDSQLAFASSSLYVIDAATGKAVFDKNSTMGLAPASTQKIITSVTAFELLGADYRFETQLGYDGSIRNGVLLGNICIVANGDPTFGSWRWPGTKDTAVFGQFIQLIKAKGIKQINGGITFRMPEYALNIIPDGWIWQDIGNYYGAAAGAFNWKENQYDVVLSSDDKVGVPVEVVSSEQQRDYDLDIYSAAKGTGDNAYIYYNGVISGTIPAGEKSFKISGARLHPMADFQTAFKQAVEKAGISWQPRTQSPDGPFELLGSYKSPGLDSIIYWFNKKSINLYGEALLKTMAVAKKKSGSTDLGVKVVNDFWKDKGISAAELNIRDGSGLSPLNRVTTRAQVKILRYAMDKPWYNAFYNALPDYNGMRMKSGTISDVKGFCGYHVSKDGKTYVFSFLVNNYNGSASSLVRKMYVVLNELK